MPFEMPELFSENITAKLIRTATELLQGNVRHLILPTIRNRD